MQFSNGDDPYGDPAANMAWGNTAMPYMGRTRVQSRQNGCRGCVGCLLVILLVLALLSFGWGITVTWGPTVVKVATHPTLIVESIANPHAVIHIHAGSNSGQIVFQPIRPLNLPFGPSETYEETSDLRTVVYDLGVNVSGTFDITVPAQTNLKVDANNASVLIEGITGQMTLNLNSGTLTVRNSAILGPSLLRENSGELHATQVQLSGSVAMDNNSAGITFQGSLAPTGNYRFSGNGGPITLTLAQRDTAHIDATTNGGSIASNIAGAQVQATNTGSALHMDIGVPPRAQVSLYNNQGSITINEQGGI